MGMADDDDDESPSGGLYEEGHWTWDETEERLVFISDRRMSVMEAIPIPVKAPTGTVEFRDDIDVLEQLRFRKRYQRKVEYGKPDVVTVQDLKDIVLFTAPLNILSPQLITVLHLPTTERFIRALILYCQYYLQTADEMAERMLELQTKIRTPTSDEVEATMRDNLADLRLLVAKEYYTMVIGGAETAAFHHMGPKKKRRSLSDKDARLFETLLCMCVQIVWIGLARRSFNRIELEVNRIFKTEIYNIIEHKLKTGILSKMTKYERAVLLGPCVRRKDKMLKTRSPLENESFCHRKINFRLFGVGVIKYPKYSCRLTYMMMAIASPEETLDERHITVGILGMPRSDFDTMLHPLTTLGKATPSGMSKSKAAMKGSPSVQGSKSAVSVDKNINSAKALPVYPRIYLPPWESIDDMYPEHFPEQRNELAKRKCNRIQMQRWQNRYLRLLHPDISSMQSKVYMSRKPRKMDSKIA